MITYESFFFQAEDGIRDLYVTGVQTCALPILRAGVGWLVSTQRGDGGWDEAPFTGTGFPKVFYLKYHMYALYFPLMALARFASATGPRQSVNGQGRKAPAVTENGKGDRHAFSSESCHLDGGIYRPQETVRGKALSPRADA